MGDAATIIELYGLCREILTLKKLRRTGWQLRGIRDGESLADHAFGVGILTLLLAGRMRETPINRDRAVLLSLVHELGEARIGDIPFTALRYFPEKSEMETQAVRDMLAVLGPDREELLTAFQEFEAGSTVEARFVRAIDKLDMLLTAAEYELTGFSGLTDFWENETTFAVFQEFPELETLARHLRTTRPSKFLCRDTACRVPT